jgi:hypothetical protein
MMKRHLQKGAVAAANASWNKWDNVDNVNGLKKHGFSLRRWP